MFLGDIIKKYREENRISQRDFAKRCNLSYTYISALEKNMDYRSGKPISPTLETVKCVAKGINMPVEDLLKILDDEQEFKLNEDAPKYSDKVFILPILGKISAGLPIFADQQIEGYLPIDPNIYNMSNPEEYFYLRVSGESMNLKIHNGDYALIQKQDTAEDGDIVVAFVNGDEEATLKRYKRISEDTVALEPMSTLPMDPIYVNLKETSFKIIGKAIGQFGKF